jgi:hypothetical protein
MPLAEIARELAPRAARYVATADPGVEQHEEPRATPAERLLGLTVRAMEYLLYDLQLDLSRFGIDPISSAAPWSRTSATSKASA